MQAGGIVDCMAVAAPCETEILHVKSFWMARIFSAACMDLAGEGTLV
jgi:hypothetical protein